MAESFNRLLDETVEILQEPKKPRGFYLPLIPRPTGPDYHQNDMTVI